MIKMSIIIPCYNGEKYIHELIANIPYKLQNIEILFIDDASTDSTIKIVNGFIRKSGNSNYRLIRLKRNRGIAFVMWYGLQQIKGQWFARFDQDDIVFPEYFTEILKYTNDNNIMIRFKFQPFYQEDVAGTKYIKQKITKKPEWTSYLWIAYGWTCILNLKYVVMNANGHEYGVFEDFDRFSKITMKNEWKNKKEIFINKNLIGWRRHSSSMTSKLELTKELYLEHKRICEQYRKNKYIKLSLKKLFWIIWNKLAIRKRRKLLKKKEKIILK